MKLLNALGLIGLAICLSFSSCNKDEENFLIGVWDVTEVTAAQLIGGVPVFSDTDNNPSGTLTFIRTGRAIRNFSYTLFNVSDEQLGEFNYTSTDSLIVLGTGTTEEQTWVREVNEIDRQRGTYQTVENGLTLAVTITLTK